MTPETYVVLLRGVNVGGHTRLPMAELRAVLSAAGFAGVRTYIQSGNVVLDAAETTSRGVAAAIQRAIADSFGLDVPALALSAGEFAAVLSANPFPVPADARMLHGILLPDRPGQDVRSRLERAASTLPVGSREQVALVGGTAYLLTPDGFGRSRLADRLLRGRGAPLAAGTARNWKTLTALQGLLAG